MIVIKRTNADKLEIVTNNVMSQFKILELFKDVFTTQFNVTDNRYSHGKIYCEVTIPEEYIGLFSFEMERAIYEHNLQNEIEFKEKIQ